MMMFVDDDVHDHGCEDDGDDDNCWWWYWTMIMMLLLLFMMMMVMMIHGDNMMIDNDGDENDEGQIKFPQMSRRTSWYSTVRESTGYGLSSKFNLIQIHSNSK